jgi:hypothetical protein
LSRDTVAARTRPRTIVGASIRPGQYTSDDLLRLHHDQWSSVIAEHERLKELGLDDVHPLRMEKREHFVGVVPMRGAMIRHCDEDLQERVNAKAGVLERSATHSVTSRYGVNVPGRGGNSGGLPGWKSP